MRLRDKASWILSSVREIVRDWNRELKEHGVSPFFGWLLTGVFSLYLIVVFTGHAILEMFIRTVRTAPKAVMRPILHVTSLVWDPLRASPPTGVPESSLKRDFCWPINVLMATPIGCVFGSVGFWMLVLVGVSTVGFVYRGRTAWLLAVPWLCYGFGTMCLLCGDDWRFFYALVLCAPLALAVLFMKKQMP